MLSILWSKYSASKFIYVRWSKSEMYGVNTGKHFQAKIIIIQTRNATTVFFFFFSYLFLLYIYVHKKCPTVFRKTEKLKKRERERDYGWYECVVSEKVETGFRGERDIEMISTSAYQLAYIQTAISHYLQHNDVFDFDGWIIIIIN